MESLKPTPVEVDPAILAAREVVNRRMAHTAALDAIWAGVTSDIIADHVRREDEQPDDAPRTPHGL